MKIKTLQTIKQATMRVAALLAVIAAPSAFAASQTWTNAPVSPEWSTAANWIGNAVPGQATFTSGGQNGDTMTFNSPLFGTIGGVSNPFRNSDTNRQVRLITFDTANCGPYLLTASNGYAFGMSVTLNTVPGGVTINPAVTNAQIIEHLTTRLQSSQNGVIGFTNNSTTTAATLTVNSITNTSAGSRPLFVNLAGTNTGNNTISNFYNFAGAGGAIHIFKYGPGTWLFSGANDFPQKSSAGGGGNAHIEINDGTLIVSDIAALGVLGAANIFATNTGVLQINGITPQNLGMSLRNGGTIRMNGTGGINGLIVGNQVGNNSTLRTTTASDVFTVGVASVVSGGVADSVLNVNGAGTVVLNTANTYIGRWSFNSGTNQIGSGALGTGASAHIAAGAILDTTLTGGFYSLTTAAIGANGTGTVVGSTASTINAGTGGTFDLGTKALNLTFTPTAFAGDTTHPSLYVVDGALSLSGNQFNINNASGTPLGAGTYRLIEQATGVVTASGGSFAIVAGAGLVAGHIGEIQVSGGNVNLVVAPHVVANLTWQGGNPDSTWDNSTTTNWFDGVSLVTFATSDAATFDGLGLANPNVNISTTVLPGSLKVDASTNVYTFSGVGQIAGPTSLLKLGTNALVLQTANTYLGGTTVSNGILRVGIENAISSSGAGNVSLYAPAIIDVNNFSNSINGLIGDGTVDNLGGGDGTIGIGNNGSTSTFTGNFKNTSGTLGVAKLGAGTLTINTAQTYSGLTTVNGGTLRVNHYNGLGSGQTNVVVNAGTLNITTNVVIGGLSGLGGAVNNNSALAASTITLQGNGDYTGVIGNGPVGAGIKLFIKSGTTRLNGVNTYSNGTVVASGATLALGVINPGASGQLGTGGIIASNGAIISLPTSVSTSSQLGNNITNIDASGTLYFPSIGQANSYNGQFFGGASNTNVFVGPMSIGGVTSFSNFLGTVVISNNASVRFFNAAAGGENTLFVVNGGVFSRDVATIRLGALTGTDGGIFGPSVSSPATFQIGAKGVSTTFSGLVVGSNNIVKVGAANLTFDGVAYYTNIVTLADPFEPTNIVSFTLSSNRVAYTGTTVVSNGTLKVVAPNNLTNSSSITLAGGTLDATTIGYSTNQTTIDYNLLEQATNTVVVTSGVVEILAGKSLNGQGSLLGSVVTDPASTITVGNPLGTLAVSGSIAINGTVNMDLNRTNLAQNSDRITAASFSGSGATLNITNAGPTLLSGSTYQLFNSAVSAFTTVNLPATSADGSITYVWVNNLAVNGSLTLTSGLNPNPAPITTVVAGNTLELNWPADHKGWTLQNQTNSLNVGISATWFNVAGSTATNQMFVPIVPGNPTVFYRMILPLP